MNNGAAIILLLSFECVSSSSIVISCYWGSIYNGAYQGQQLWTSCSHTCNCFIIFSNAFFFYYLYCWNILIPNSKFLKFTFWIVRLNLAPLLLIFDFPVLQLCNCVLHLLIFSFHNFSWLQQQGLITCISQSLSYLPVTFPWRLSLLNSSQFLLL